MKRWQWLIVAATFFIWGNAAKAQERIQFRSLDSSATVLDGYLYPSTGAGRHPAVVFLHGCSGMFDRSTGLISRLERDWASVLNGDGYSVLMVDSFRPRSIDQTCAPTTYNPAVVAARPKDAYGALYYLQNQSFVRGDRIALIGWSAGGGTVLRTIPQQSGGVPLLCRKAISGSRWRSIQRCVAISEKQRRGPATSRCWSCSAQPMCGRRLPMPELYRRRARARLPDRAAHLSRRLSRIRRTGQAAAPVAAIHHDRRSCADCRYRSGGAPGCVRRGAGLSAPLSRRLSASRRQPSQRIVKKSRRAGYPTRIERRAQCMAYGHRRGRPVHQHRVPGSRAAADAGVPDYSAAMRGASSGVAK